MTAEALYAQTEVLNALSTIPVDYQDQVPSLKVDQISVGMESLDNVLAKNGTLVTAKGQIIALRRC